jgi:hypothetical protein
MADSVYTADLFGSPADDVPEPVLAASNCHYFLNLDSALASVPDSAPHPLLPLPELSVGPDFAVEQCSPATRETYRSSGPSASGCGHSLWPADLADGQPGGLLWRRHLAQGLAGAQ